MKPFLKKFILITLIIFLILIGGVVFLLSQKPVLITPFTYQLNEKVMTGLKEAETSDLLIIGDRMGLYLNSFLGPLKDEIKTELKKDLRVYNWSREKEGLHRTINKIKSMKRLPPLIIYHGGSYEWFDKKFDYKEKNKILYNFEQFADEKIISSIITFPDLSRAIYKKITLFPLGPLNNKEKVIQESNFEMKEIEYLYYQEELRQLVDYIKQKKSNIILITTPINILVPPRESCPNTSSNTIVEIQQEIEGLIKEGNFKLAYNKATQLEKESLANARTYYLLGMTAKQNYELKIARNAFTKANVFDCYNWRSNSVFNSIIVKTANHFQAQVLDFETEITNAQLQDDSVFFDEIFPQNLYYNNLIKELTVSVKKFFNI
jgi:hypothetical protein